jgi:tetratricopeptide (TPR) repeat protein
MFTVTFYSYKGGVGRTSALVNVAYRLARRGKRVFVIDFDLEAPGVDAYSLVDAGTDAPGLVEYISAFTATGTVPDLGTFVLNSTLPGIKGRLFVMRGGKKDNAYKSALGRLDWKILYRQRKGFLFVENLKAGIRELFNPDYLLVDARTGLSDVSGICTMQLPDLVVLLFSLNEQNVTGVSGVFRSIKENRLNREIGTMLVASPVPEMPEWVEARATRFEFARIAMGKAADVVLPYDPFLAFKESIVDGDSHTESKTHLGKAYDLLMEKIISKNPSDVVTLLNSAIEFRDEGQYELAESHYRQVVDTMPQSVEAWTEFGKFDRLRGKLLSACEYFEKAYSLDPTDPEVLAQLASTYANVDKDRCQRYYHEFLKVDQDSQRIKQVSSALRYAGLEVPALEGFTRNTVLDKNNVASFIELGQTYMQIHHYRQAADAYRRGLELTANNLACAYNLGAAYERLDDPRAIEYYAKAIGIFEQATPSADKRYLANVCEAMSRAYIALGKVATAVQLLEQALRLAAEVDGGWFFSSSKYEYISHDKFVAEVTPRLENARRRLEGGGSIGDGYASPN